MSEEESLKINISARVLGEEQLKNILPEYGNIEKMIESIRSYAQEYNKKKNLYDNSYESFLKKELCRNNNNVFSILGDRGSGKTSALLTIKNKLTVKNETDIMLPLIIPEDMGEGSYILGWTICSFEKILDNIESCVYNNWNKDNCKFNFFKNCRKYEKNDLRKSFDELLKYYTYANKEYRDILSNNYDGINDYKEKTKEVINAERELLNRFEEFIDILIAVKKDINNSEIEPLIYIFIDDIDLNTCKCLEIVNMILKYLCNVNIVVFVSGDYQSFSEAITISLLKREGILNNVDTCFSDRTFKGRKTALQTKKILAQDILKKVLPPAYRMYMPKLTNRQKAEFIYSTSEENLEEEGFYTLVQLINNKLLNIDEKNKEESFLYYKDKLIDVYFSIFDDNPRGLMNIYYFLYELRMDEYICLDKDEKLDKEKKRKKQREYCKVLKEFLNIIIESNSNLSYPRLAIDKAINIKCELENIFINYNYIKEVFYDPYVDNYGKISGNKGKRGMEVGIQLFLVAHFIEQLVILRMKMDNSNIDRRSHGLEILINMINSINGDIYIPRYNNSKFVMAFYSQFNNKLSHLAEKKLYPNKFDYFTKVYLNICYDLMLNTNRKVLDKTYFTRTLMNILREDYSWGERIIKIILNIKNKKNIYIQGSIKEFRDRIRIDEISDKLIQKISSTFDEVREVFNTYTEEVIIKVLLVLDIISVSEYINSKDKKVQINLMFEELCKIMNRKSVSTKLIRECIYKYIENTDKYNNSDKNIKEVENINIDISNKNIKEIKDINIDISNKGELLEKINDILYLNIYDLKNMRNGLLKKIYTVDIDFLKDAENLIDRLEKKTKNKKVLMFIKDVRGLIDEYGYFEEEIEEDDLVPLVKKASELYHKISINDEVDNLISDLDDLFSEAIDDDNYELIQSEEFREEAFIGLTYINILLNTSMLYITNKIDIYSEEKYQYIKSMCDVLQDTKNNRRTLIKDIVIKNNSNTDSFIDGEINNVQ